MLGRSARGNNGIAQASKGNAMPEFVIERDITGVGQLGAENLKGAPRTSCSVLRNLGPEIQWVHSYVTDDKIYRAYRATDVEMIGQHAEQNGFPAHCISEVRATIDPTKADSEYRRERSDQDQVAVAAAVIVLRGHSAPAEPSSGGTHSITARFQIKCGPAPHMNSAPRLRSLLYGVWGRTVCSWLDCACLRMTRYPITLTRSQKV